ncbi:MAG: AAA family ATPase [Candidatus Rokubacteria bacterium]|nr:AAA family ATPase [Candidatus Rokubacteria bacterium]
MTAADILAQPPEPIPWVWEAYLGPGTLALLVAFMKVGKSTLAYTLAVAVARGTPFLTRATKKGGVLILAIEEHPQDIRRRLERLGMQSGDPIYVHFGSLDASPKTFEAMADYIRQNEIALVIIDTLAFFWTVINENDNAEMVRRVRPLLNLARETNIAVLALHHERKSGGEDGRGIRGGSALFALVDQALLLDRRQGGASTQRVLKAVGRYDETPRELILKFDDGGYRAIGSRDEAQKEDMKTTVRGALSDQPKDIETLVKETGLTGKAVRAALGALGAEVTREGKGVKGDPARYRLAASDSIPSQPSLMGEDPNSGSAAPSGRLASALDGVPGRPRRSIRWDRVPDWREPPISRFRRRV